MSDKRAEWIAGLRELADVLEANPDVVLPYGCGTSNGFNATKLTFYTDTAAEMRAIAQAMPCKLDKKVDDTSESFGFELHGKLRGLHFYAAAPRDEVCTKVITGTREVQVEKIVKAAVIKTPAVFETVTETVEDFEWVCSPLLGESVA